MFFDFFDDLREVGIPVTIPEYMDLLLVIHKTMPDNMSLDGFYHLSRTCLVKDEQYFDRFDQVFGAFARFLEMAREQREAEFPEGVIPEDWMRKEMERYFTEEERAEMERLSFDEILARFQERLENQGERHQGGGRHIGTGGYSPFGWGGYAPSGIRVGGPGQHQRATKVWEKREYGDLDSGARISSRNIRLALKRLRLLAHQGTEYELNIDETIRQAEERGGILLPVETPERVNIVRVLVFFDVGGSMDRYIYMVEELFNAAEAEFKQLEFYYFHNFFYEYVWTQNRRRNDSAQKLRDIEAKFDGSYRVIVVGDASMAPEEISRPHGVVEWRDELNEIETPGAEVFKRMRAHWPHMVWLNPEINADDWSLTSSNTMIREMLGPERMFPLTLGGVSDAMDRLKG